MTALQYFKSKAAELQKSKEDAIKSGCFHVSYVDNSGKSHTLYYHSNRWNDRPCTVKSYRG